jgi:hypothetical protein
VRHPVIRVRSEIEEVGRPAFDDILENLRSSEPRAKAGGLRRPRNVALRHVVEIETDRVAPG